jgi:hypothetical protein
LLNLVLICMAIIGIGQDQPVQLRTGESNPRLVQVSD